VVLNRLADGGVRLTLRDYLALPDDADYEVFDGVLDVAPRPIAKHQIIAVQLLWELVQQVPGARPNQCFVLDADLLADPLRTYVSPDLMYFRPERWATIDPEQRITLPPDLVVEVLSPSTRHRDLTLKRQFYARLGIGHYWVLDRSRKRARELTLQPDGSYAERVVAAPGPFQPAIFPGVSIDLGRLFA
jgi:Uma2 family endonuclease